MWDENADPFTRTVAVTLGRVAAQARRARGDRDGRRRRLPHAMTPAPSRRRAAALAAAGAHPARRLLRRPVPAGRRRAAGADLRAGGRGAAASGAAARAEAAHAAGKWRCWDCCKTSRPTSPSLLAKCNHLIAVVGAGPKARGDALAALRIASAIGLGDPGDRRGRPRLARFRAGAEAGAVDHRGRAGGPPSCGSASASRSRAPTTSSRQLADTFDVMLERLDAAFTSQKRFVANAAHELRTPLTAMRTAIEVTLSKPTRTPDQLEAMAAPGQAIGRARRSHRRGAADARHQRGRPDGARTRSISPRPPRTRSTPRTRRSISATSRSKPRSSPRSPAATGCCSSA